MAKNQNIRDQQELNRLTREYETMLNRVNSLRARIGQNPIRLLSPEETGNIRNLTAAIKTLAGESSALNEQLSEAKKSFQGLNDEIKEFGEHLQKQNKGIEELVDSFKVVAEEVKTVTKDLSKIEVPSLTQRIGFEIEALPEIVLPELKQKISFTVGDVPETTLPDLQQSISYALGTLPTTDLPNLEQKVNFVLGTLPTTDLPNLEQKVNFVLGDIPTVNLADIQQRVNVSIGEVPEISTPIDKILNIVVKGVKEAEAIFKKLAEPFSKTVAIGQEVQVAAQASPQQVSSSTQETRNITYEVTDDQLRALHRELVKQYPELQGKAKEFIQTYRTGLRDAAIGGVTLRDSFNELAGALSGAGTAADSAFGRSIKAGRQLRNITQDLVSEVEGYGELSLKDLEAKQKQFRVQKAIYDTSKEQIDGEVERFKARIEAGETLTTVEQRRLDKLQDIANISDESFARIEAQLAGRIKQEKKVNQLMGVSGALLKGANSLMGKLGISSQAFGDGLEEAQERMENTARAVEATGKMFGRTRTLFSGLIGLTKAFGKLLTDPLMIIGQITRGIRAVTRAFLELNAKAVEFGRLTGRNIELEAALNDQRITAVEYVEAAVAATNELGLSASGVFGPNQIAQIGEAVQLLGLSAEQATTLALRSEAVGMSLNSYQDGLIEGINAANKFTESAVAPGIALRDIADISEDISLSLQNNPVLLGKAAVQARALGLSLKKVDDIAGGLLDFESSIEAELEAQLLTGRALNLSKAREFALMNDMEGVAREIANQGITAADFAGMNRLAQESLAQALGMSRQELAKTLQIQSMSVKEQEEANRLAMAQQSLQDQIRRAVNALQLAFAPIVAKILPGLVKFIDKAAGKIEKFVEGVLNGKGAFESLKEAFPSTAAIIDPLQKAFNWLQEKLLIIQAHMKNPELGLSEGLQAAFPALGPLIKVGEVLGKIIGYLGENPKALTAGLLVFGTTKLTGINVLGETLKGLGGLGKKGLGKLGGIFKKTEKVGVSSANKLKTSFGNTVTSIFKTVKNVATELAKTLKNVATEISKGIGNVLTNIGSGLGKGIEKLLQGLGRGLAALGNPQALLGAVTIGLLAGTLWLAGKGLQQFAEVSWEDIGKGFAVLFGLGVVGALAGYAAPFIFAGALAIGAMGLALLPFAAAVALAAPGISRIADSLISLKDVDVLSLYLIGPALMSLAVGLAALTASDLIGSVVSGIKSLFGGDSPIEKLTKLSKLALPIYTLSTAFERLVPAISNVMEVISNTNFDTLSSDTVSTLTSRMNNLTTALGGYIDRYKKFSKLDKPEDLIEGVHELGTLIPTMNVATNALNGMAAAVMSLATALKAITTDDIRKIQDLVEAGFESDTRSTFEIIAEPVNKLARVLGGGEEGDAADIVAKLDELINVVREGGNVYMDGREVGTSLVLGAGTFR